MQGLPIASLQKFPAEVPVGDQQISESTEELQASSKRQSTKHQVQHCGPPLNLPGLQVQGSESYTHVVNQTIYLPLLCVTFFTKSNNTDFRNQMLFYTTLLAEWHRLA